MRLKIASHSSIGLVRDHNEDTIASAAALGLVVLADGMGGYQAGEVASAVAVSTVLEELTPSLKNLHRSIVPNGYHPATVLLEQAVIKANTVIYRTAEQQAFLRGMGTTIVAAVFHGDLVSIAHVGDSRLYRLRGHEFKQITVDHSVLQELIDCGFYTREQARRSPNKNLVTRALGVSDTVVVDVQEQLMAAHDIYLLCSDGLNDMLEDSEMHAILKESGDDIENAAQALVNAANDQGGEDNISVILVRTLPSTAKPARNWLRRWLRWFMNWCR